MCMKCDMRPSHVTSVSFNPATLFVTKIAHIKNITHFAHIMNLSSITHILAVWGLALGLLLLACVCMCAGGVFVSLPFGGV